MNGIMGLLEGAIKKVWEAICAALAAVFHALGLDRIGRVIADSIGDSMGYIGEGLLALSAFFVGGPIAGFSVLLFSAFKPIFETYLDSSLLILVSFMPFVIGYVISGYKLGSVFYMVSLISSSYSSEKVSLGVGKLVGLSRYYSKDLFKSPFNAVIIGIACMAFCFVIFSHVLPDNSEKKHIAILSTLPLIMVCLASLKLNTKVVTKDDFFANIAMQAVSRNQSVKSILSSYDIDFVELQLANSQFLGDLVGRNIPTKEFYYIVFSKFERGILVDAKFDHPNGAVPLLELCDLDDNKHAKCALLEVIKEKDIE